MLKRFRLSTLAPVALAVGGIMLLVRVSFGNVIFFLPANLDIIILLFGLGFATVASLSYIIQELTTRLRESSVLRARKAVFEEHQRFLHRLDHELKNPLTALRAGLASLALTTHNDRQNTIIMTLEKETFRLSQLITNLRKLAEIDTLSLEMYPVDIEQFINTVVELEQYSTNFKDRDFTVTRPEPDALDTNPAFYGDQDLLLLAVHNVLDNAFKYTQHGDRITLNVTIDQDYLVIQVGNSGQGISEADLPYVWEELYRGSDVTHIPGDGIGLALVRKIIEQHDGEVSITSVQNHLTTVTLKVPLS